MEIKAGYLNAGLELAFERRVSLPSCCRLEIAISSALTPL